MFLAATLKLSANATSRNFRWKTTELADPDYDAAPTQKKKRIFNSDDKDNQLDND